MKLITLRGKYGSIIGNYAQVDDEDYEELSKYKWIARLSNKKLYCYRTTYSRNLYLNKGNGTIHISMHRHLMYDSDSPTIDHKDGNGLNNQRNNIREATYSQNAANRQITGKWKGVFNDEQGWRAIVVKDQDRYTKRYKIELDAVIWYNEKSIELHGEYASLNIITKEDRRKYQRDRENTRPPDTDTHKSCRKCWESKLRKEYGINNYKKDGIACYCKDCSTEIYKEKKKKA